MEGVVVYLFNKAELVANPKTDESLGCDLKVK